MKRHFLAISGCLLFVYLATGAITAGWLISVSIFFGESHSAFSASQAFLVLFLGVATLLSWLASYRSQRTQRQHTQLMADLQRSCQQYLFDRNDGQASATDQEQIAQLTESLRQAVTFTREVAQGESAVEWPGMNDDLRALNQATLAGELMLMREQMNQVRVADQKRFWAAEGLSQVAEITRQHQRDVQQLADQLLRYLVRYVQANQGMLFLWEEDQQHLALLACYAYNKKKFVERTLAPGEGLMGQAFLEKETLHLTEIPADYVAITSGLGEALPTSLLLVPLKTDEQIVGMLELASFAAFPAHFVAFLEEAGKIIASAVATAQLNQQTQALLAQSQQQAEELRAQEEEMRQNLEELQATQEEMERKTLELLKAKEELEQRSQEIEVVRAEEQKRAEEQINARNNMLLKLKQQFEQRERTLKEQLNSKQ